MLSDGKLTLIDNQIDQTTGTLKLKASFANDDERLWPGLFVNVCGCDARGVVTVPARRLQGASGPTPM